MRQHFAFGAVASCLFSSLVLSAAAAAEVKEVRFADTFGIAFLQMQVLKHEKLIEKHAAAQGLGKINVTWQQFAGASGVNDALLTGSVDFGAAGVPGFLILADRTRTLPNRAVGIASFGSIPNLLNTNDPKVKSIADFNETHKIAVPSLKVSIQAILLQMAAAKEFGQENYNKLDRLTVAMPAPESAAAIASGIISASFSTPPFQYRQLQTPGVRTLLSSFDILGGPASLIVLYGTEKFRKENPKTLAATIAALNEATELIKADKKRAAQIYLDVTKDRASLDSIVDMISRPDFVYTMTPQNVMKYATFMHRVGTLKHLPTSWKDLFVPEIHALPGS